MFWNKKKPQEILKKSFDLSGVTFADRDIKLKSDITKNLKNTFARDITTFKITENVMTVAGQMFAQDASQLQRQKILSNVANTGSFGGGISGQQLNFFAQQGFIGYQTCALLAQNWLILKACTVPARDAVRNGYKITVNDGAKVDPKKLIALRDMDKEFDINGQMREYITKGRIFGIRIMKYNVDGIDYEKPFNIDGVTKGAYKGMTQIDPYWITPELDIMSASNPGDPNFYKPTYWRVNGQRIHHTHLITYVPNPVADILKPTYIFGGPSLPQLIFTRVYAAEKCANESPLLLLTKRTDVLKCDMQAALADQALFESRLEYYTALRDNFGVKTINSEEDIVRLDTNLTNVDDTIMTQYQLVAAIGNMPATKLIETTPKGFSSSGEYEEASYHEYLESTQTNDLNPVLDRHHMLCIKSRISPDAPFSVSAEWEPLDAMTADEKAEVRKKTADADKVYIDANAIDGRDLRKKIIADPESGFNGLEDETEDDDNDIIDGESDQLDADGMGASVEAGKTVQQISMNGAQVLALVQILSDVASNTMPAESAKAAIAAAYNTLTPEEIDAMIDPVAAKAKTNPNPQVDPNASSQTSGAEEAGSGL